MNLENFKERVEALPENGEEQADSLCFEWLEEALESNGREGRVGLRLLQILRDECMP